MNGGKIQALNTILNPRSVAFLGASNRPNMGTVEFWNLKFGGYEGELFPIHPREENVLGSKAYRSVEELPEVPDLLVIVLPTLLVPEYLEKAGEFGIRHAIIVSGGFAETGNFEGQRELVNIARRHGIHFIGPNCIGLINTHAKMNITWFPYRGRPGGVSFASQSGSWACHIFPYCERNGIGLSKSISVGNEAIISLADCLEFFAEDKSTKSVGLYVEGVKGKGREFAEAARSASLRKPVCCLYAGGTKLGGRAGVSHTASLGGNVGVYRGVFRHSGVVEVEGLEQLLDFVNAFDHLPLPEGRRVGTIVNSGGAAVTFSDACDKAGLVIPEFSATLQRRLREVVPPTASVANPVDITFDLELSTLYNTLPNLVLESNEVDAILFYGIFGWSFFSSILEQAKNPEVQRIMPAEYYQEYMKESVESFMSLLRKVSVPFIIATLMDDHDDAISKLAENGIPFFSSPERAVHALKALVTYAEWKREQRGPSSQEPL